MKSLPAILLLTLSPFSLVGCYQANKSSDSAAKSVSTAGLAKSQPESVAAPGAATQEVSLDQAIKADEVGALIDRKILKDAEVTLEVSSPLEAQRKVSSIAGSRGGFVVTSESKQRETNDPNQRTLDINLIIRVPAAQFEAALEEIRALGDRVLQNKETGQDVTEEFIDLEARIKTQKALEAQFLEIMKQAGKISDALAVQQQIAGVRTEIERLEGRRRFLDNKASLSTITVNLQSPRAMIVTTTGFGQTLKESVSDSLAIASAIVLFIVRVTIMMIPVFFLLILPGALIGRYLVRRARRLQLARKLETVSEA